MPEKNKDLNLKNEQGEPPDETEEIKIKVNHSASGLAEFTKRKLPDEKELNDFEEFVEEEAKEEEIEESLNEIYQDGKGGLVDVRRLDIKRKRGFLFWFFSLLFLFGGLAAAALFGYNYYLNYNADVTAVEFKIDAKSEVAAGEEFVYLISYKNKSQIAAKNARAEAVWPENFIFISGNPEPGEKNNIWNIGAIGPGESGVIEARGKIVAPAGSAGIILASLTYTPANFSSLFKKEASATTRVARTGLEFEFERFSSALVGEENEINLKYKAGENSYLSGFRVTVAPEENIVFAESPSAADSDYRLVRPGVWEITNAAGEEKILPIKFKFTQKKSDLQAVAIIFEHQANDKFYKFLEEKLEYEVMKSDLNLTLFINGSREDSPIDFGQKLGYSIAYKNRGETDMKDAVIMAVLTSDFLDWTSLEDRQNGKVRRNAISWTKDEVPELALVGKDEEGTIDFFIKTSGPGEIDPAKAYEIRSYAQFTVGGREEISDSPDNRSNTIVNKFKSDLKFGGEIRYFSEDNIPVGQGANPPQAGEKTVYKVYWKIANNLHELNDAVVRVKLPSYSSFEGKTQTTAGALAYDEENREVVWRVGRLPVTVFEASAQWNVGLTPSLSDKNKILVILPEAKATAFDTVSQSDLESAVRAKTTKLEDDEIGANDGMVQ